MRVLLDENLPRKLARLFSGCGMEVATVRGCGWGSKKNGELLGLAEEEFEVFLTADRNLPYQQDLSRLDLAVVVLEAKSNTFRELAPLVEEVEVEIRRLRPGAVARVPARGRANQ